MDKFCENCRNRIEKKQHYFEVLEWKEKKIIGKKYVHRECQTNYDNRMKQALSSNQHAHQLLGRLGNLMDNLGIE